MLDLAQSNYVTMKKKEKPFERAIRETIEESKYYTPKPEEIHVGMEIEVYVNDKWIPANVCIPDKQDFIMEIDTAKVPNALSLKDWLYFILKTGVALSDSSLESKDIKVIEEIRKQINSEKNISITAVVSFLYKIRVKCLDRNDIENEGFIFAKHHDGTTESMYELRGDEWILDHDTDFRGKSWVHIYTIDNGDSTQFSGEVKNKSELKKVLIQTGVIKDE